MIVRSLTYPISKATLAELESFEKQFSYPLGPSDDFSISHGTEYLPFFSAMGFSTLLVAEIKGRIAGTLVLVQRQLAIQDSTNRESTQRIQQASYICDLKVRPDARSGPALSRLLLAAAEIVRSVPGNACYGIVMSGTSAGPAAYTGRLGIPAFSVLTKIAILRFRTEANPPNSSVLFATDEQFTKVAEELAPQGVQPIIGDSLIRSILPVKKICHRNGMACGLIEDTRRGKRLFRSSGEEIVSAHLSRFRWCDTKSAAEILRESLAVSFQLGYPGMFCSLPQTAWCHLKPLVQNLPVQETTAIVYGYQFPGGLDWWIDTTEI